MADKHIRRRGEDYAHALLALIPQGQAWPRSFWSTLSNAVTGLCQYWGFVDGRAADLLEIEYDPRATFELLSDYERNWGLPDPCFPDATTLAERRAMLVLKMTMLGAQSRQWFIDLAAWLGYTITISEFSPFMVSISNVGDTRPSADMVDDPINYRWTIGPPEMRYYWVVHIAGMAIVWFRVGSGQCGIDPHCRIARAENLECLITRLAPAHTQVIFDYSGLEYPSNPMAGTP